METQNNSQTESESSELEDLSESEHAATQIENSYSSSKSHFEKIFQAPMLPMFKSRPIARKQTQRLNIKAAVENKTFELYEHEKQERNMRLENTKPKYLTPRQRMSLHNKREFAEKQRRRNQVSTRKVKSIRNKKALLKKFDEKNDCFRYANTLQEESDYNFLASKNLDRKKSSSIRFTKEGGPKIDLDS